jgi:hypothetical protein
MGSFSLDHSVANQRRYVKCIIAEMTVAEMEAA